MYPNNNNNNNNSTKMYSSTLQQHHHHLSTNMGPSTKQRSNKKRIRTIFTPEQLKRLEQEFGNQMYLVGHYRCLLAESLNLSEAQVKVWFQNRRIKFRKLNSNPASVHSSSPPSSNQTLSDNEDQPDRFINNNNNQLNQHHHHHDTVSVNLHTTSSSPSSNHQLQLQHQQHLHETSMTTDQELNQHIIRYNVHNNVLM